MGVGDAIDDVERLDFLEDGNAGVFGSQVKSCGHEFDGRLRAIKGERAVNHFATPMITGVFGRKLIGQ